MKTGISLSASPVIFCLCRNNPLQHHSPLDHLIEGDGFDGFDRQAHVVPLGACLCEYAGDRLIIEIPRRWRDETHS